MTDHLLLTTDYHDMRTAYDRLRMIPTSENADIYLIRSHVAYWCGIPIADQVAELHSRLCPVTE